MKVELLADMSDLEHNCLPFQCPKGTTFRSGDEIFICSPKRPSTFNKTFITFGFFPVDLSHPELTFVLVIDENKLQNDNTMLTSIFRLVPLIYVALVFDGRCSDQTLPLLEEMVPLCKNLFEELKKWKLLCKQTASQRKSNTPSVLWISILSISKLRI